MDEINSKYYDGFDGYPEIQFIKVAGNGQRTIIRLWDGFFDSIMNLIQPGPSGWTGLALPYHLYEGWYVESPWRIPDIMEAIEQFTSVDIEALDDQTNCVLQDIIKLLSDAKSNRETVLIGYE
ncbi:MAG: dihydroorotate dehydrogenase (quinone) [Acidobacteriota bacterium]